MQIKVNMGCLLTMDSEEWLQCIVNSGCEESYRSDAYRSEPLGQTSLMSAEVLRTE